MRKHTSARSRRSLSGLHAREPKARNGSGSSFTGRASSFTVSEAVDHSVEDLQARIEHWLDDEGLRDEMRSITVDASHHALIIVGTRTLKRRIRQAFPECGVVKPPSAPTQIYA